MNTHYLRTLLWLACLITSISAFSHEGECGFIQNPDRQAYCRTTTGGGSDQCGFIRDRDMQVACRAKTR
jgi:hypothetical protein